MGHKNYLCLHKNEWNRLINAGASTHKAAAANEYVKSLMEKSQNIMKSWPDSPQARILKLHKQKYNQRARDFALLKLCKEEQKKKIYNKECIEKAKNIIFDESCYGRRLISALLESKTLEERDVQIEFKKKLLGQKKHIPDVIACSLQNAITMEKEEKELKARKREEDERVAEANRAMHLTQTEIKEEYKRRQIQSEIEDIKLIEKIIQKEKSEELKNISMFKQDVEQIKTERKIYLDRKAKIDRVEERRNEIWRKYEDRKKQLMKEIHKKRFQKSHLTDNYELVKKLNDEKQNRYDEFINTGITRGSERLRIQEEQPKQNKETERKKQYQLMQSNKKLAEAERMIKTNRHKCLCDTQSSITACGIIQQTNQKQMCTPIQITPLTQGKTTNVVLKLATASQNNLDITIIGENAIKLNPPAFAPTRNDLVNSLKMKEKAASPWSGAGAADARFALRAGDTLHRCRYKRMARKVVDDYRRANGLNPQTLPVSNY